MITTASSKNRMQYQIRTSRLNTISKNLEKVKHQSSAGKNREMGTKEAKKIDICIGTARRGGRTRSLQIVNS